MRTMFLIGLLFTFFFISFPSQSSAQTCVDAGVRCAECDACGYCRGRAAPGNWVSCRDCLYPELKASNPAPEEDKTLIIEGTIGEKARAITPALGKYYTQLGCISNINSFTDPAAIGGVLNFTLTRIFFPIVGVLSFLTLIYGAFLLATAQGNPEQLGRGKSYVIGALVGLVFVIGVVFIVGFIAGNILKIPGFGQ